MSEKIPKGNMNHHLVQSLRKAGFCLFSILFTRGKTWAKLLLVTYAGWRGKNSLAQQFVAHNYLLHYTTLICWAIISIKATCTVRAKYHSRQAWMWFCVPPFVPESTVKGGGMLIHCCAAKFVWTENSRDRNNTSALMCDGHSLSIWVTLLKS